MREKYETLSLATLKELAKGRGMRGISTLKKGELIEAMLRQDEKDAANKDIAAAPSVTRRERRRWCAEEGRPHQNRRRQRRMQGLCRKRERRTRQDRQKEEISHPRRADRSSGHRRMAVCPGRHTTSGHPATVPGTIRQDG